MKKNHKRISAAVLSLALGFTIAGAPIVAPMAGAQAVSISAGKASTVDLGTDVSLTIQKYSGEPTSTPNTPLEGVSFKIQKIDLGTTNLNTIAGWEKVAGFQADLQADPANLPDLVATDNTWTVMTDEDGEASISTGLAASGFENFKVGAYLVTEQSLAGYTVAAPFIVTVPFTTDAGAWDYHQVVKPKNQTVTVEKSVDDAGVRLGKDLSYVISASLPAEDLTSLVIQDPLPAELSRAIIPSIVVRTADADTQVDNKDLILNTDYTVEIDGPDNLVGDNDLTVTLTTAGLVKLNGLRNNNPRLTLQVAFKATVVALPTNGVIRNDAIVKYPNLMVDTIDDPVDPNDADTGAETRLGSLTVTKQDSAATPAPITGTDAAASATFELWRCSLESGKWTVSGSALPVITDANVGTVDELPVLPAELPTSFSTNFATGIATIYGVQTFNFENNATTTGASTTCLVETKAPAGYNLNPEPIPVTNYANATTPSADNYAMVANVKNLANDDIVNLPETGGKGTMALIAAGVIVAAAGGAAAVRGNRARNS